MRDHIGSHSSRIVPVILAGSGLARPRPPSRQAVQRSSPPPTGTLTQFQRALSWIGDPAQFTSPVIVTTAARRKTVAAQALETGIDPLLTLVEPAARNTAPAILAAAHAIRSQDRQTPTMLVLPSDQMCHDLLVLDETLGRARYLADAGGLLVVFGVNPTGSGVRHSYITRGAPLATSKAYLIDSFVERPSRTAAERLFAQGSVYWSSRMFCFPIDRLLDEARHLEPTLLAATATAVNEARCHGNLLELEPTAFAAAPALSIETAILERTQDAAVVPLAARPTAGGSMARSPRHGHANRTAPATADQEKTSEPSDKAALPDAEGDRQKVESANTNTGATGHRGPMAETRPWGSYYVLDRGDGFQVKRITVNPGGRLSLQYHHHRAEHWTVVGGVARVTIDDAVQTLAAGEHAFIPLGAVHRLENLGIEPVHLIEVQSGSYLGEDDIVRVEDVYGRTRANAMSAAA